MEKETVCDDGGQVMRERCSMPGLRVVVEETPPSATMPACLFPANLQEVSTSRSSGVPSAPYDDDDVSSTTPMPHSRRLPAGRCRLEFGGNPLTASSPSGGVLSLSGQSWAIMLRT